MPGAPRANDRTHDLRQAALLSTVTICWNVLAGAAAVLAALDVGSLSLAGFGVSAMLDSVASIALLWRFRAELRDPGAGHRLESMTVRIVGATLLVIALYVAAQAFHALRSGSGPDAFAAGVLVAGASVVVLPPLAAGKMRIGSRLRSRALRGDGMLTGIGAALAALTLVGLWLDASLGWWWSDAVAALVMCAFLVREGIQALSTATQ